MGQMRFMGLYCALLVLVTACASQPVKRSPPGGHHEHAVCASRARVPQPLNLSGRPLNNLDACIFTGDSLRASASLTDINTHVDFMKLLHAALCIVLEEQGFAIVDDPAAPAVIVAIESWDASTMPADGTIAIGASALFSSARALQPPRVDGRFQLLDGGYSGAVIGEGRMIDGRYEALAYHLARKLIGQCCFTLEYTETSSLYFPRICATIASPISLVETMRTFSPPNFAISLVR